MCIQNSQKADKEERRVPKFMMWCWHRWTKWIETEAERSNIKNGIRILVTVQKRYCEKCGYRQVERL